MIDFTTFTDTGVFTYFILPLLIFVARIFDVSIGTIRVIFISKGYKLIAPILGFFEVIIWLLAIRQIMVNLTNVFCYLAYGAGFAAGTYIGMYIEEKMSIGKVVIRIITKKDSSQLISDLRQANFNITALECEGNCGEAKLIFTVTSRQRIPHAISLVNQHNPQAFYSIEDIRFACEDEHQLPRKDKFFSMANFKKIFSVPSFRKVLSIPYFKKTK